MKFFEYDATTHFYGLSPTAGVYALHYLPTRQRYVGESLDIFDRWNHHIFLVNSGQHPNYRLRSLRGKWDDVEFILLEEVLKTDPRLEDVPLKKILLDQQKYWILQFGSWLPIFGFNTFHETEIRYIDSIMKRS